MVPFQERSTVKEHRAGGVDPYFSGLLGFFFAGLSWYPTPMERRVCIPKVNRLIYKSNKKTGDGVVGGAKQYIADIYA